MGSKKSWTTGSTNGKLFHVEWNGGLPEQFYPNWVYEDATTWSGSETVLKATQQSESDGTLNMSSPKKSVENDEAYVLQVIEEIKTFMGASEQAEETVLQDTSAEKDKGVTYCFPVMGMGGECSKIVDGKQVPVSRLDSVVGFELRPHKKSVEIKSDDMSEPP